MKTRTTIIAALAICMMAAGARAQENGTLVKPNLPKNEFKVSMGIWPITGVLYENSDDFSFVNPFRLNSEIKWGIFGDTEASTKLVICGLSVSYKRMVNEKLMVTFSTSWSAMHRSYYVHSDGEKTGVDGLYQYITFRTGLQFIYKKFDGFSLYGAFSSGCQVIVYPISHSHETGLPMVTLCFCKYPSFSITPIGISIGKTNSTDIELGFGTQGLLNIGYSRKF